MARLLACLPALAVLAAAPSALAQVNVEALRADLGQKPLVLALSASFAGHLGNTNGAVGSAAAFAGGSFGPNLVFVKLQGDYAEFNGKPTISAAFAHARYNYKFLPFLWGEIFVQVEENAFQRLALRQLDGAGVRFAIVQRPEIDLFYGTAWMLDYEKLSADQAPLGPIPGARWFTHRWSNYVSASWRMSARARISDVLYVQPRINGFNDFRLLNDASFVVDIDKRLSVKIDCQVHHNHMPPSRVRPTDVDTVTSLVLTL